MAGLSKERRNGKTYYRIQFYDKDGARKSLRLVDVNKKDANVIKTKVESLVSASISGSALDNETSRWVATIGQDLADKLTTAGFGKYVPKRESSTLGKFVDGYIDSRTDLSFNTKRNFRNSREKLVRYFGAERDLRDITPGDADEWRQSLVQDGLSEATISKAVKHAKQMFKLAQRKGLVDENPFADVKPGSDRNDARKQYIDQDTVNKVIDAAPDAQWRLIIALARYGGLRTPSEAFALKWSDIDWAARRFTVTSPKTSRQGKPYRVVPLFPELLPYLEQAYEQAETGTVHAITRYRDTSANLRTQLLRIIRRAGVAPWERLFQNLRASRQTELENRFPSHVVCQWLGNTETVARRHYLQVTEEHMAQAVGGATGGATGGAIVVQESVPQRSASDGSDSQNAQDPRKIEQVCEPMQSLATWYDTDQYPGEDSNLRPTV